MIFQIPAFWLSVYIVATAGFSAIALPNIFFVFWIPTSWRSGAQCSFNDVIVPWVTLFIMMDIVLFCLLRWCGCCPRLALGNLEVAVNDPNLPPPARNVHPPVNVAADGAPMVPLNGGAREYRAADALLDLMARVGNHRRQLSTFLFKLYQDAIGAPEFTVPAAEAVEMISF